jgi:prepilin-type processing-associated H-X9-DG protein
MGTGTTHLKERIAASVGELIFVEPQFKAGVDITNGGVLTALPALLSMGLLESTDEFFDLPKGYYGLDSLFLLLGMMALTRQKSIESLRYCAPGEWGKLLGLDRIPEVRTLRDKVKIISEGEGAEQWSATLCKNWMESTPGQAGVLYIDGHVRVYNGSLTKLPRHHVARQRLCLRATSDYWVNAMDGQPFFVVNKVVDPGLIQVLEEEIVPRLEQDVPGQPEQQDLEEDPLLHRFSLVFDREGYSPGFFKRMKNLRIACLT